MSDWVTREAAMEIPGKRQGKHRGLSASKIGIIQYGEIRGRMVPFSQVHIHRLRLTFPIPFYAYDDTAVPFASSSEKMVV